MTPALLKKLSGSKDPQLLRRQLQEGREGDLLRRRWIVGLSLAGIADMAIVALFQTGILKRLPDPPLPGFNSMKVNSSDTAYRYGVPDGIIDIVSLSLTTLLAALGGLDRARRVSLVSLLAAGKEIFGAAGAAWYFYQMPTKVKAWCIYCLTAALLHFVLFGLTLPEAKQAVLDLLSSRKNARRWVKEATPAVLR